MDLFARWTFYAVPWASALLLGVLLMALGRRWWHAAGVALMTVPLWDTTWGILSSIEPLAEGGRTLAAYSTFQLSYIVSYKFLSDLGYLGVGFLLHESGGSWRGLFLGPREWASRLVARGVPMGRVSEGRSALYGVLFTPALALASIATALLLSRSEALNQNDESSVFDNMTLYHAFFLSAAAAVGEELVYRAFLQNVLARRMHFAIAVVAQAVFFGFAHAGYGTWSHILLPTLFGLIAGLVAWRWGLWAAIALHFTVDFYAFLASAAQNQAWLGNVLGILFLANLIAAIAWGVSLLIGWSKPPIHS